MQAYVCASMMCEQRGVQERQKETGGETDTQKMSVWRIFSSGVEGIHLSITHILPVVIKLTLTVICGGELHQRASDGRGCSLDGGSKRQPGCAGGHWWKLTVG